VESKSFPVDSTALSHENRPVLLPSGGARIAGFGWFLYLVFTSLLFGFAMGLSVYWLALLISLGFPRFRRVSDAILRRTISFLMGSQPWLQFEYREFMESYTSLRKRFPADGKTGILLISNHRSHLDTFLLLSRVPGIRVLAKRGLFAVPLLGMVMWTSRQIPVRRKDLKSFVHAMEEIGERLAAGEVVYVFPEMTRASPEFPGVAAFNPAPFLTAIKAGVPILPFAIRGTGETWPKGSFSFRRGFSVDLVPLPVIEAEAAKKYPGAKDLAEYCRTVIEAAYRAGRS
jgi:1-acyl-sn-glycerol-3-phosphate acyltransferase